MENNSQEDKQHKPTGKRIADLKGKGSVMRSRDLTSGLLFVFAFMLLSYYSDIFKKRMEENFILSFDSIKHILTNNDNFSAILIHMLIDNFLLLLPIFCFLMVAVCLSPFIFGGWNFTLTPVKFSFEKMNPMTNLKNIFSTRLFIEVIKSMLKAFVIIGALIYFIVHNQESILNLMNYSPATAINNGFIIIVQFIVLVCILTIFLISVDMLYNYQKFQKDSKMTKKEVDDESKDHDGNPMIKQKIRAKQYALVRQRIIKAVPQANVIITNPTHYAIALRYDERKDRAPKVFAKGTDAIAQQIRLIAISNGIPLYEAPLLARAIYHTTKIGFEISPDLYKAVAIVLTYVNQLKNYQMGIGSPPQHTTNLEIPPELIFNE